MTTSKKLILFLLGGLSIAACSGTQVRDSWSRRDYEGTINNVYIIGIAKINLNRMIFEDTFADRLTAEGISAVPSYKGLPTGQEADRDVIIKEMRANNCDSVLLTKLVGQRTDATITSGQRHYRYVPARSYVGGRGGDSFSHYNNWATYYRNSYRVIYEPPTVTKFIVLIVESALYDLQTEEMIWSARMETDLEGNLENMMRKFVDEVTKDLKEKGII